MRFPVPLRSVLTVAAMLGAPVTPHAAQEPQLIVEIGKREIYEGESVLYRVILNHVDNPSTPVLEGFDSFSVQSLGEQSLDSRQITIINGRRTEIIRRGRQYDYNLTPLQSGILTIPAPRANVGNQVLMGRVVTLRVIPPADQDLVILDFRSDRTSVYPMQPFELFLTIAVKELPNRFSHRDPLSVQGQPPVLTIPWLDDDQLPEGVEPENNWRDILQPLISRRGNGFQVNNIGSSSVFSLFDDRATGFHPRPERTTRTDANGNDVQYWEYRFLRRLVPRQQGLYEFGPITLKGTFADKVEKGNLEGRSVYAVAKTVDVTVRDVPLEGRPASYIGAVGSFQVSAELSPEAVRVGDPMTLTLILSGQGTLVDARPPAIDAIPEIAQAFRTYDATEETKATTRRFTWSLRPLTASIVEFPPIPVSWFDVDTDQYVTRHTNRIPLVVREAETLSDSDIVAAASERVPTAANIEASAGGVFANDAGPSSLRNEIVRPGWWVLIWAGMLSAWLVASFGITHLRRVRDDPAILRRRKARSRARSALDEADSALQSGNRRESCDAVRRAVTGLIADFACVPESGLTGRDAADHLKVLGIEKNLQTRTQQFLDSCDAARYGAASDGVATLCSDAGKLVDELVETLRRK